MILGLTRRQFLSVSVAMAIIAFVRPGFAGRVRTLTEQERGTLCVVVRTIFPHHTGDGAYQKSVEAIERTCSANGSLGTLARGLAALELACGRKFSKANERTRVRLINSIRGSDFFRVVYSQALDALYGSPGVWSLLAYALPADILQPNGPLLAKQRHER